MTIYKSPFSKIFSDILDFVIGTFNYTGATFTFVGFKHFLYMPLEVGEVMASCEAQLLRQKIISGPFTAKDIADGALQDHLTQEDYNAPMKVNFFLL